MTVRVRKRVQHRVCRAEPLAEEVDRERKAIHLGEERDDEADEDAHRPPLGETLGPHKGQRETEDEKDVE